MKKHTPETCYRITPDTYVICRDYNDSIIGANGMPHAQGSHSWRPERYEQIEKKRWHEIQRNRRRQHYKQRQHCKHDTHTQYIQYAKIKRNLYAMDAVVNIHTLAIIRCHGYTHHIPRHNRQPTSRLGQLCNDLSLARNSNK